MPVPQSRAAAPTGEKAITCTNPASGANWQIKVDYDHRTVDSNPAEISDTKFPGTTAKDGGNYTLDRKSGNLTVVVASSTGGYFLYDTLQARQIVRQAQLRVCPRHAVAAVPLALRPERR